MARVRPTGKEHLVARLESAMFCLGIMWGLFNSVRKKKLTPEQADLLEIATARTNMLMEADDNAAKELGRGTF